MKNSIAVLLFLFPFFLIAQRHVLVLGFDGMSGKGVQKVSTPNFDRIKSSGAYTYKARAVIRTVSSPNWASMINGAPPKVHGVRSNEWERRDIKNKSFCGQNKGEIFPTIFKILREQRPQSKIECVHDWGGFARLANTESMDTCVDSKDEFETCRKVCELLESDKPDFLFVHFDHVDHVGHTYGHFTPEYYRAIQIADSLTGIIIETLGRVGIFENTYIIITADHGGIRKGHGGLTKAEIQIPWFISGPNTKHNFLLTASVRQFDTASTIAYIFGLTQPDCWKGKPVKSAFLN